MEQELNYRCEKNRFLSFSDFPTCVGVSPRALAAAGFWYTKDYDCVRCAFCNVVIGCWEEDDDPRDEHRRWSVNCSFFRSGVEVGNVPMSENEIPPLPEQGSDECGIRNTNYLEKKMSIPIAVPEYVLLTKRLETFKKWHFQDVVSPDRLADAGFFYMGK